MKRKIIINGVVLLFTTFFLLQEAKAQWGMDYDITQGGTFRFSRLRIVGIPQNAQNINNEKAIGVYTQSILPASALEVNTDFTHFPAFLTTWYNRGEVFRTSCPTANAPFWRMFRDTTERFRIYNPNLGLNNNGIILETVQSPGGWMAFNTALTTRMFILDGGNLATNGYVGIGNGFTGPKSRLHLHDSTITFIYAQWTNQASGAAATDGLKVGINPITIGGPFTNIPFAEVRQQENAPLTFFTNGNEKMRIMGNINQNITGFPPTQTTNLNPGFVGIGCTNPMSMLHIGNNTIFFNNGNPADGYRPWMINGTYTSFGSDMMYVGFHNILGQATIDWGNDPVLPGGPDRLVFRFTAATNIMSPQPFASGTNGLEGARFVTDGNRMFIGFGGDPLNPGQNAYTNNPDPGNTVEINSIATTIGPTNSGLRFTDLNSSSAALPINPGPGVLAVDANGDVIYVQNNNAVSSFGLCSALPLPTLAGNSGLDLNTHNLYFDAITNILLPDQNDVLIGYNCGSPTTAKLDVLQQGNAISNIGTFGIRGINRGIGFQVNTPNPMLGAAFGVFGQASGIDASVQHVNIGGGFLASGVSNNYAVYGVASGNIGLYPTNNGGVFRSTDALYNNGVTGIALGTAGYSQASYGGTFSAFNGVNNYGVYAVAYNPDPMSLNYGIYATVATNNPVPNPLPPTTGNFAGYFNGSVLRTGSDNFSSDINLKTNIDSIHNAMSIIEQLKPRQFYYDTNNVHNMVFSSKKQYGFIAQDVETVLPELVGFATQPATYDTLGNILIPAYTYKTLSYQPFTALVIKAVQEQNNTIDSLKDIISNYEARFTNIESQLNNCCNQNTKIIQGNNDPTTQTDVNLSNRKIVLDQNAPNPFKDQTTITYEIKSDFKTATIIFVDNLGDVIKEVPITQKGKGQLNVYASDLTSGIYTYTIVVDGNTIDTKKMVKMK